MRICDWLACARRDPTGVLELESASDESARLGVRELTLRNLGSAPDGTLNWILSQKMPCSLLSLFTSGGIIRKISIQHPYFSFLLRIFSLVKMIVWFYLIHFCLTMILFFCVMSSFQCLYGHTILLLTILIHISSALAF